MVNFESNRYIVCLLEHFLNIKIKLEQEVENKIVIAGAE